MLTEDELTETDEILEMMKQFLGCEETEVNVLQWVMTDKDHCHQNYKDSEIVCLL